MDGGPEELTPTMQASGEVALKMQEKVMDAYTKFALAQRLDANVQLQGEAAWVYFKMGTLYERLQRRPEAEKAFHQMLTILSELSTRHATDPSCFRGFFKVCESIQPTTLDPTLLEVVERRLDILDGVVDRLLAAKPGNFEYLRAKIRLLPKLGVVRYQRRRPDVEPLFREALRLADRLIAARPEDGYPHSDRADVLDAYAQVLIAIDKPAEARGRLEAALEDLEWVAADGLKSARLATQMERISDIFEEYLDDRDRAEQIQLRADQVDPRVSNPDRPRLGRPLDSVPTDPEPITGPAAAPRP